MVSRNKNKSNNKNQANMETQKENKFEVKAAVKLLLTLFAISLLLSFLSSGFIEKQGNVAFIEIHDVISFDNQGSFGSTAASANDYVDLITSAEENPSIKVIVLDINSPGGEVVASKTIAKAISETNKPTIALIREVGASGAYWIASASDQIFADEASIVGSIGVIGSYVDLSGLLTRYNASYQRLVSGERKDTGTPFRKLTDDEEAYLQQKLDLIHDIFIKDVAKNRNIDVEKLKKLSDGSIFLGIEAKDLKLIDQLGGEREVKKYIESNFNITVEPVFYKTRRGFVDAILSSSSNIGYSVGTGIGNSLTQSAEADVKTTPFRS